MKNPDLMMVAGGPPPGAGEDMPMPEPGGGHSCEKDTVPLSALGMPDETEQLTPPEVGDEVNYSVAGKVVSISGQNAVIARTAINGQELGGGMEKEEPSETDLESEAAEMDGGGMKM